MISSYRKTVASILALAALVSCGKKHDSAATPRDIQPAEVAEVTVIPLGARIAGIDSLGNDGVEAFATEYSMPLSRLLDMNRVADTVSVPALRQYASSRSVTMFQPEIKKIFPTDESLNETLTAVSGRLAAALPGLRFPDIYSVVIPFNQSVVAVDDSTLFVGLNHYLGESHPAYNGFADYIRRLKEPDRVAIDISEAVVALSHPFKGENVISRLLYEGALVEAVMQATGIDEATALGYDSEQYGWAVANEEAAWNALVNNKMLFSTDADLADRLTAPAPATTVLNNESPGRLGRYIGHRIVASYLRHNKDATLAYLLSPEFYNSSETLTLAGYQKR